MSIYLNADCMNTETGMPSYPDKYFDLAIVDPPYGINGHESVGLNKDDQKWNNINKTKWDIKPGPEYFKELFRVSKNQIIWGGNYFDLPPSRCILIWDKVQRIDMADCELAWTSYNTSARIFTFARGNLQGFRNPDRFHPTEKPIELYKWIVRKYSKTGDRILDTHVGSGSSLIAFNDFGLDYTGYELNTEYYKRSNERIKKHMDQLKLFVPGF